MATLPRIEGAEHTVPLAKSIAPQAGPATSEGQGLSYLGNVVEQQSSRAVALASMFEARSESINDNNLASIWGHERTQRLQVESERLRTRMLDPQADPNNVLEEWGTRVKAVNDEIDLSMKSNGLKDKLIPLSRMSAASSYETMNRELIQYKRGLTVERAKGLALEDVHLAEKGVIGEVITKGGNFQPADLMYTFNRVKGTYLGAVTHGIISAEGADSNFEKSVKVIAHNAFGAMSPKQALEILRDQPKPGYEADWNVWQSVLGGVDKADRDAIRKNAQERLLNDNKFANQEVEAQVALVKSQSALTRTQYEQGLSLKKLDPDSADATAMLDSMTLEDRRHAKENGTILSRMRTYPDPVGGDDPVRTVNVSTDIIANPSQWTPARLERERKYFTAATWDNKILPLYYGQLEKEKSGVMTYARDLEKSVSDHFRVNPLGASSHFSSEAMGYYRTHFWTEYQLLPLQDQMNPRKVQALSDSWQAASQVRYDQTLDQAVKKIYADYPSMKDKPAASVVRSALLKKMPSYEVDAILEYLESRDRLGQETNGSTADTSYTGTGK